MFYIRILFALWCMAFAGSDTTAHNEIQTPCTLNVVAGYTSDHPSKPGLYLTFKLEPQSQWKVYAPPEGSTGYPPKLTFKTDLIFFKPEWPQGMLVSREATHAWVYDHAVEIPVHIALPGDLNPPVVVQGFLDVLACSDTVCLPLHLPFQVTLDEEFLKKNASPLDTMNLWIVWVIAFLGGVLLNMMPCVLPVLSLKLVQMIQTPPSSARMYHLGSICGIQGLFGIVGGVWAIMKWYGIHMGWGFHFQNPLLILILLFVMVILWAQMMGWYSMTLPLWLTRNTWVETLTSPWAQGVGHGVLMTLLATPCTAPFLGAALGISLIKHPPWHIWGTFFCIGAGLSLPYIVLLWVPPSCLPIPKPGLWMIRMKRAASWGIGCVALWLTYLLCVMVSLRSFLLFLLLVLGMIFFLKSFNKIRVGLSRSLKIGWLLGSFALAFDIIEPDDVPEYDIPQGWIAFDERALSSHNLKQRPLLLTMTARWCLTCHVNERVWSHERVQALLKRHNIVLMQGDLTRSHPRLEAIIRQHHRAGVPFSVVYTAEHPEGLVFSEFLTVQNVIDTIEASLVQP